MKLKDSIFLKESNQGKLTFGWISLLLPIILLFIGSIINILISGVIYFFVFASISFFNQVINLEGISQGVSIISPTASTILVYFLYVKLIERRPISSMGFSLRKGWFSKYIKGFIIGGLLIGLITILMLLTGSASISYVGIDNTKIISFILIIIAWIIQGASEEIMIRGHMLPVLSIKWGIPIAIIISSLYFSVLHIFNNGIDLISLLNLALAGVLFTVYVFYDDSLWGACALHSSWNFVQGNIVGSNVSGTNIMNSGNVFLMNQNTNKLLNGGEFGLEGSIITTIVLILAIIVISILIKKKKSIISES